MQQLKKWFIASVATAGVAGAVAVPGVAQAATVPGGTFDTATSCWSSTGAAADLSTVPGHGGGQASQLRGRGAVAASVELGLSRADGSCGVPVTPGHAYTVSAWYQANSMVRPSVYAYRKATGWAAWFTGAPYAGSTPWDRIETTTPPVPAGTEKIAMSFAVPGNAKMVVDEVAIDDATTELETPTARSAPFSASFPKGPTSLVTNEYAAFNPTKTDAARSPIWQVTSGSLFSVDGNGDTGRIDNGRPNATSSNFTDSSVYRMNTTRSDFKNVSVAFRLNVQSQSSTSRTPAVAYDGVHIWLRHVTQYSLYAASVARRDNKVVLKKKCKGGPSNDGTYYTLGKEVAVDPVVKGKWTDVAAGVQNNPDGTVTLTLSINGKQLITAVDSGVGCAPITAAASVGIRGDNTRFLFNSFTATAM